MERESTDLPRAKSRAEIGDFIRPLGAARVGSKAPFQLRNSNKLYMAVTIDPERVQPHLPAGIRIAPSNTAILSVYTVADSPFGPYGGSVLGVAIAGHDSPDGMEAVYWMGGYTSDNGHDLLRQYDAAQERGTGRIDSDGDIVTGHTARSDGSGAFSFRMRVTGGAENWQEGAYHYLGADGAGGAQIFSLIGYARNAVPGVLESMAIARDASPALRSLEPVSLGWSIHLWHINMIMGEPRPLSEADGKLTADTGRGLLLATFDRQKRAAVIVDRGGTTRFVNEVAAIRLGRSARIGERLRVAGRNEQAALEGALAVVVAGKAVSDSIAIPDTDGLGPLIVQVSSLDPSVAGDGGALVVFTEPGAPPADDPTDLLRLLGLTPAEARLAAVIGAGASPREAAAKLDISENTARTTIKVVFDKLRIGKQSELARIVSRLEMI